MINPESRPWWRQLSPLQSLGLTLLIVLGALIVRKPGVFLQPQFWAEDAMIFYHQAYYLGAKAVVLPYNGYYHLVPRLIAGVTVGLDPLVMPIAYLVLTVVLTLAVAAAVFSSRLDLPYRPACALALVLVPHTGEVFLNITNLQWVLAPALVLVALARDPTKPSQWITDIITVVLLGLTGPFVVLWLPLFAWRIWQRRSLASWIVGLTAALAAAVQISAHLKASAPMSPGTVLIDQLTRLAGMRIWGSLLAPAMWVDRISVPVGTLLATVGWLGVGFLTVNQPRLRTTRLVLIVAAIIILGSTFYKFRGDLLQLAGVGNGDRYFYIPKLLMLWWLICEAAAVERWRQWLGRGLLAVSLQATATGFRTQSYVDYHWADYARRIRAGDDVVVPVNPPGCTVRFPGRPTR